jgi:hypothetical protein
MIYTNDLFSFRKELKECNGNFKDCRNLLAAFCNVEKLSLQDSCEKLVGLMVENEKLLKNLQEKIYARDPPISDSLRLFVRKIGYQISGNWLGSIGLDRYTGRDCSKAELVMGLFKYSKDVNIYKTDNQVEKFGQYFPHD